MEQGRLKEKEDGRKKEGGMERERREGGGPGEGRR